MERIHHKQLGGIGDDMLKCALCAARITKKNPFSNPESHKKGCPIYVEEDEVAQAIKEIAEATE